ncbi:MAG: acyltransferase [Myxococcales bacterium]|nr:acyltransferase [Myxococcota bacterium]MDW8283392.1 acyltransferase [Myxococcales bacterium]
MSTTRDHLRSALNRLFSVGMWPLLTAYRLERRMLDPDTARRLLIGYGGLLALWPGFSGDFARRAFYRGALRYVHPSVTISQGSTFSSDDVCIEADVYIGGGCVIGRCRIGQGVLIADHVHILPGGHTHRQGPDGTLLPGRPADEVPVHIGAHSWIGTHAVVMADVGARSIVGAGAIVVRPIPDDVLAVGNPARVVRRLREGPPGPLQES